MGAGERGAVYWSAARAHCSPSRWAASAMVPQGALDQIVAIQDQSDGDALSAGQHTEPGLAGDDRANLRADMGFGRVTICIGCRSKFRCKSTWRGIRPLGCVLRSMRRRMGRGGIKGVGRGRGERCLGSVREVVGKHSFLFQISVLQHRPRFLYL